ncbi:MAG: dihydropteroate synthase [Desulfatitalea sp.]|nr:dihydropteroate synthase [Desulfatitalea sp.]NNK02204.1 dihydropteroate synthase [Desulfatitalea sp.]
MIIVGELINTSRKRIEKAVREQDAAFIQQIAKAQAEAGADYIDVNAGTFLEKEEAYLPWLVQTVQAAVALPCCLDSPNPAALNKAMSVHRGVPLINSISLETDRYDQMLPVITRAPCKLVALCMGQTAMPTTSQERVLAAEQLIDALVRVGIDLPDIFIDPLVQPVSVDTRMGTAALSAIGAIRERHPQVNIICGLSNISFGLPERRLINRYFLALALGKGLSAAILDPTDRAMSAALKTARMLLDQDEYCSDYIEAYEGGILSNT